jgi:hypothetical protein
MFSFVVRLEGSGTCIVRIGGYGVWRRDSAAFYMVLSEILEIFVRSRKSVEVYKFLWRLPRM